MIVAPLFHHASQTPDQIALIDDHGRYTYGQLAGAAVTIAALLKQTERQQVGIMLPAGFAYVASFYGTLLAGKSVVPLNYLVGEKPLAHIVADSGIDMVLTAPPLAALTSGWAIKTIDLAPILASSPIATAAPVNRKLRRPDEEAVILYTSGTSGPPKGVELCFANIQSDVDACIEWAGLQPRHHFLGIIPLFHAFGMTAMMVAPVQLGALVIYQARFSPAATVQAIKQHQVSLVFGVPSMYAAIARLKNAGPEDFAGVYALICGGEPLPPALSETFQRRFGQTLYEGYGLSETSPVVTLNVPRDHRAGSVGKPVPGAVIRIVDESGHGLPAGESGEIWINGPMVMNGYHGLREATEAAFSADGFFKTGDLGKKDLEGYLYITGRKKDLIIVAGEKVFPREIEEQLLLHAAVSEAAVVGQSDPSRGESIIAFVIAQENQKLESETLRQFLRSRGLAGWKIPREIRLVKDLPRSPTGKILRRVLAEQVNAEARNE